MHSVFVFLKTVILSSLLCVFLISQANSAQRVALVVGNSNYSSVGKLPNPVRDATNIGAVLSELGFEVIYGQDLTHQDFLLTLKRFSNALKGSDVGLFFYAGHGMQISGQNYLLPTDVELETANAIDSELVALNLVLKEMDQRTKTKIVLVDACRDNRFMPGANRSVDAQIVETDLGLAPLEAGSDTLVAFSTEPGSVARDGAGLNSPFSEALLHHISTPNLDVARMMRRVRKRVMDATQNAQVPWSNSSLTGDFSFNYQGNRALTSAAKETALWDAVKDADDPDLIRVYLKRYPNGEFTKQALALIKAAPESKIELSERENSEARDSQARHVQNCLQREEDGYDGEPSITVNACSGAVAQFPNSDILKLIYGRALDRSGNETAAAKQFRQSAELGNTDAMVELAVAYDLGKGVEWRAGETMRLLEKAAVLGNTHAMEMLGHIYLEDRQVEYDDAVSFEWFRQAAEGGNASAAFSVATAYKHGEGVRQDHFRARYWFQVALADTNADQTLAMINLADLLATGQGGDKNPEFAQSLLMKAAAQGDQLAMRSLAEFYLDGTFESETTATAVDWTMKAIREGGQIEAEFWFVDPEKNKTYPASFRKEVQNRLREAGVYSGAIDGVIGKVSLMAVFQYANQ